MTDDRVPHRLTIDRDVLTREAEFLVKIIDSESTDPVIREQAQHQFAELNEWLCYRGPEARNPSLLLVYCGYKRATEEFLAELPSELLEDRAVQVILARYSAELADSPHFSDLFRLDMVDSLNQILGHLIGHADEYAEAEL
jgi:hypothetical protein